MKKFLCDQMCAELGRWLRTAGYDTLIVSTSMEDQKIFNNAVDQGRSLLTRDKYFKEVDPEGKTVIYLRTESLDEWARQLKQEHHLNWLYSPFSRCLQCNTLLNPTTAPEDVPQQVLEYTKEFWVCPTCHQVFWRGSHTERMEQQLREWSK